MPAALDDQMVRIAAFQYLDRLQTAHGDALPWSALTGCQGSAARDHDHALLRQAMSEARPLIYFQGLSRGYYTALWPAVIVGDDPVVPNGLSMCKIHHAAFDAHILGVRPDCVVEIRADVLTEIDGPMLRHGLQELHGARLLLPRAPAGHPDRERLEIRYDEFRRAS